MKLPCPYCGEREVGEFRYGGDASKQRPTHGSGSQAEWHDYYFLFDNPKGEHEEYWQHVLGCRRWFKLRRDTSSNTVLGGGT